MAEQKKEKTQKKTEKAPARDYEKEITELKESLSKEKEDYLRLMAEFETFRRRSAADRLSLVASAAEDTVKGLLPIIDDFERALAALEDSTDVATAKEGTQLIYNKLTAYLGSKGLSAIDALGKEFDTDFHEAVAQVPVGEEDAKGKVFDVVQKGYLFGGKVIRYAKVVVGV